MDHELNTPWTLYYLKQSANSDDYASSIHKIGKFDTVEGFWSYYSHLKRPHEIEGRIEFHLFRNDVRGMWEDDENRNGGKWTILLKKEYISLVWEKTVLSLIGELVHEDVVGAIISVKEDTGILSFWTKHGRGQRQNDQLFLAVADSIAKALELPNSTTMKFKNHSEKPNQDLRKTYSYVVGQQKGAGRNQNNKRVKQPIKQQPQPQMPPKSK